MQGGAHTSVWVGLVVACIVAATAYFFPQGSGSGSDTSSFFIPQVTFDAIRNTDAPQGTKPVTPGTTATLLVTEGVERWYTNDARTFSFRLPDGFSAPPMETGVPGVEGMVLQAPGREPLAVLEYRVAPVSQLTVENVQSSLSGRQLTDVREVIVQSVVRGLAFKTEDGIEVWMIHNGHLYRIITPESNEDLVTFVLLNWYFAPPFPSTPK